MAGDTTNSYQPLGTLSTQTNKCQALFPRHSFHIQFPLSVDTWYQGEATFRVPSTCLHDPPPQTAWYPCMASDDISIKPRMGEHYSAEPGDHQVRKSSLRDSCYEASQPWVESDHLGSVGDGVNELRSWQLQGLPHLLLHFILFYLFIH